MAKRLLIAAETFSADEMLENGVLDHLVMRAQFKEFVQHYAEQLAALAPLSVRAMKSLVSEAAAGPVDRALYDEFARQCNASEDLREGLAAINEKRDAVFRGR
jgi:enoyl-CoA hydratase/carnithine racemase